MATEDEIQGKRADVDALRRQIEEAKNDTLIESDERSRDIRFDQLNREEERLKQELAAVTGGVYVPPELPEVPEGEEVVDEPIIAVPVQPTYETDLAAAIAAESDSNDTDPDSDADLADENV